MTLGETPWVDRNLNEVWGRLIRVVPVNWLPAGSSDPTWRSKGGRVAYNITFKELGCGHYGCVMPTGEPGLVFKITSDVTEARFVSMALTLDWPEGIVKYTKLYELHGLTHRRRPLFVLWREEAKDIGVLIHPHFAPGPIPEGSSALFVSIEQARRRMPSQFERWQARPIQEGVRLLQNFRDTAGRVRGAYRDLIKRTRLPTETLLRVIWDGFDDNIPHNRITAHHRAVNNVVQKLRACYGIAQSIANTDVVYHVGVALMEYMDEGILLADVHLNNIGRNMEDDIVITDPGHAIIFNPKWFPPPEIPRL